MEKKEIETPKEDEKQTTFEDNSVSDLNDGGEVQNVYTTKGIAEQE